MKKAIVFLIIATTFCYFPLVAQSNFTEKIADLNLEMVFVKGGIFNMGCTPANDKECEIDEKPVHKIKLTDFFMAKTEITNAQYCIFLNEKGNQKDGGTRWINISGQDDGEKCRIYEKDGVFYVESGYENYPVIYVSWYGARAFADWLSQKTGKTYRLPTEAEWEYAARSGGKSYKYAWGNGNPEKGNGGNIRDEAYKKHFGDCTYWKDYNDGYIFTAPVNSFGTNEIGLADMGGNVWEWCLDVYTSDFYKNSLLQNPCNDCNNNSKAYRVSRGGSWQNRPIVIRCSDRMGGKPDSRENNLGFRICSAINKK